jgi:toxin ParE1/3/4
VIAPRRKWLVRLSAAAESDLQGILLWTAQRFGVEQARAYERSLKDALKALETGPTATGVRRRDDIGDGLYTLHVARGGRRGRHLILFRTAQHADRDAIDGCDCSTTPWTSRATCPDATRF